MNKSQIVLTSPVTGLRPYFFKYGTIFLRIHYLLVRDILMYMTYIKSKTTPSRVHNGCSNG